MQRQYVSLEDVCAPLQRQYGATGGAPATPQRQGVALEGVLAPLPRHYVLLGRAGAPL